MSQTILNEESGDALRNLAADVDGALRYHPGDTVAKEHVERWGNALKTILAGRVTRGPHQARRPRASASAAD